MILKDTPSGGLNIIIFVWKLAQSFLLHLKTNAIKIWILSLHSYEFAELQSYGVTDLQSCKVALLLSYRVPLLQKHLNLDLTDSELGNLN